MNKSEIKFRKFPFNYKGESSKKIHYLLEFYTFMWLKILLIGIVMCRSYAMSI